jgi:hypothetical protein
VQGLAFFPTLPLFDRRLARAREPIAAARLYLDGVIAAVRGARAAVVADGARLVAGAGMPAAELARVARLAHLASLGRDDGGEDPAGDLFLHRVHVRGREHVFATLGARARRVRDVERDLARILGA